MQYFALEEANKKWLAAKAYETGQPVTAVVNAAIAAAKTGKKFDLPEFVPLYLKRAVEAREKRLSALKRQAGL